MNIHKIAKYTSSGYWLVQLFCLIIKTVAFLIVWLWYIPKQMLFEEIEKLEIYLDKLDEKIKKDDDN